VTVAINLCLNILTCLIFQLPVCGKSWW